MDNLYVQQLSVSFDGFKALDIDIFEVAQNELRGGHRSQWRG